MESEDRINALIDQCVDKRIKLIENELTIQEEMISTLKGSIEEMVKVLQGNFKKLDLSKVHGKTAQDPSTNSSRRPSQKINNPAP